MKVIHIESGLGNQMLSYCEYLALKKMNPNDDFYLETVIYDIPECNELICQWNGYELERIFGIKAPQNIKSLFSEKEWQEIMDDVKDSKFWLKNWNYPVYVTKVLNRHGLLLKNYRGDFESPTTYRMTSYGLPRYRQTYLFRYLNYLRRKYIKRQKPEPKISPDELFLKAEDDIFTGQKLLFKYQGSGIERIEDDVRRTFVFPAIEDEDNSRTQTMICNCNSIAIHARRGDMIGYNFDCYVGGYFRRCVSFMRQNVTDPVFFFFCDPPSVEWTRSHAHVFGLNMKKDKVFFVDWNKSDDSWRDMQLMAQCKHQIITRSSFGWWGAWLNQNPDKITCSPDTSINTTHHF